MEDNKDFKDFPLKEGEMSSVNPLAIRLFNNFLKPTENTLAEVLALAKEFLKQPVEFGDTQETGLLAYLFSSAFSDKLPPVVNEELVRSVERARDEHSIVDGLLTRLQVMNQEVQGYFRHQSYPFDYFQPAPLKNELATMIISFESSCLASILNKKFASQRLPNMLAEAYVNPKTGSPGIWMSVKGVHFDATKLH